jgi:hypothetical protein
MQSQILYVIPITSVLGGKLVAPVVETGTITYSMHKEGDTFPGVTFDTKKDSVEGCRWWYLGPEVGNQPEVGLKSFMIFCRL